MPPALGHIANTGDGVGGFGGVAHQIVHPLTDRLIHAHRVRFRQIVHRGDTGEAVGPLPDLHQLAVFTVDHDRCVSGNFGRCGAFCEFDHRVLRHSFDATSFHLVPLVG